jgi:bifunctional non-homologous end joining protein LigD
MKLDEYRKKRDASRTNEPLGDDPRAGRATWRGAFVIHQHDATRMHWDLRLEASGVLASFAVPRGISLDPAVKHLAVHTEDHPIEYLDFEGVIPDGNYGAGPMIAWDCGVVRYLDESAEEGLESGKLHFVLEGKKVRGRFALVRVKPESGGPLKTSRDWLLFKKDDAFAKKDVDLTTALPKSVFSGLTVGELAVAPAIAAELEAEARAEGGAPAKLDGRTVSPMLSTLAEIPKKGRWLYELKLDGVRIVATKDARGIDLRYRSGRSAREAYPEVVRALAALPVARVILDGEIVAFDERGRPDFERLARRIHGERRPDMRYALAEVPVTYVAFDLLAVGDVDVAKLPLEKRKGLLSKLVRGDGVLRALDHLDRGGEELFAFCRSHGLEGIVSKRADGPYREGPKRTGDWVKTKTEIAELFVVVGTTRGESSRAKLGALDLATYEGDELRFRGKVGSGLDDRSVADLLERLRGLESDEPTALGPYEPAPKGRTHVRPEVVVEVRFLEWSEDAHLRHPVFLRVVPDADPRQCTARPHDEDARATEPAKEDVPAAPEVRFTNRQKIFFPEDGLTKGDLIDYYDAIAPTILPYLKDRPVMLVRYPDGIDGKSFYQWNVPHGCPSWIKSVVLGKHLATPEGDDAHQKHVFLVDRREALLYVANLACIPVHVLGSRIGSPEDCDFLTIDFDVNLASLATAIPLAHTLREILGAVGLEGFPKTSGQTGLHVFVPLGKGVTPSAAKVMAELFGRLVCERHPDVATMERIVQKRGPRVYVDTGQTGPSRTIVAPYSVRATKGARVSTPLRWQEVTTDLDPGAFTIRTVPERVRASGDPMAPLLEARPDARRVLDALGALLAGRPKKR